MQMKKYMKKMGAKAREARIQEWEAFFRHEALKGETKK